MTQKASTEHVHWKDLAKSFTDVTGPKAVYKDIAQDEYFAFGIFSNPDGKVGHFAGRNDTTLQAYRQNFTGFWNMFKVSGDNVGNAQRDYNVLDEIYPGRIRTMSEWMKMGYTGEVGSAWKDYADVRKEKIAAAVV